MWVKIALEVNAVTWKNMDVGSAETCRDHRRRHGGTVPDMSLIATINHGCDIYVQVTARTAVLRRVEADQ